MHAHTQKDLIFLLGEYYQEVSVIIITNLTINAYIQNIFLKKNLLINNFAGTLFALIDIRIYKRSFHLR